MSIINILRGLFKRRSGANEERGSENGVVNTGFDMSHKKRNAVSRPVPINYLLDHIVGLSKKNGFKEEFIAITTGPRCPVTASLKDENRDKNRFYNILAYDHTRVVLEAEDVEAEYVNIQEVIGDYINANYINGYKQDKGFIAAQGPLNTTVADFWRMVWQNNSSKIVMVTNLVEAGRSKCAYYWPHEGSDQYGNIRVRLEKEDTFSEYVVRILELTKGKEKRTVLQYHFVAWPDEGCPTTGTALLALQDVIQSEPANESEGPVVIHCSAGIGRTGTFLAVDHLRKQAAEEGVVDVMACVDGMRQERVNMVQSLEQYAYIYTTILEALVCGQVRWPAKEFPGQVSALVDSSFEDEETPVVKQFKVLEALKPSGSYNERVKTAIDPANKAKNRKSNLLPAENVHPYLQPIQGCASSYINCVLFNSFKARDAVGVTQMPLPHTQIDFWRLVADFKCFCIVMLNEQEEDSESVPPYLPSLEEPVTLGSFTIKADKISEEDSFVVSDLMISASHKWKEEKPIHHVRLTSWPDDQPLPDSPRLLIDLHKRIKEICGPSYDGRTLVHCLYGAEKSGLVCAALHILDAIEAHAYVDVFNVVKKMRQSRPQFIATQEQYNYLHLVAKEYMESRSSS